jgi:predicted nuclease of predicted toxin-antitoxin system
MKLLLDENLPKKLKQDFSEFEVYTVRDQGWSGKKNGELIALMITERFDALLTFDKNLQYQQNFNKYAHPVLVHNAPDNSYLTLVNLVPRIKEVLANGLSVGSIEIK